MEKGPADDGTNRSGRSNLAIPEQWDERFALAAKFGISADDIDLAPGDALMAEEPDAIASFEGTFNTAIDILMHCLPFRRRSDAADIVRYHHATCHAGWNPRHVPFEADACINYYLSTLRGATLNSAQRNAAVGHLTYFFRGIEWRHRDLVREEHGEICIPETPDRTRDRVLKLFEVPVSFDQSRQPKSHEWSASETDSPEYSRRPPQAEPGSWLESTRWDRYSVDDEPEPEQLAKNAKMMRTIEDKLAVIFEAAASGVPGNGSGSLPCKVARGCILNRLAGPLDAAPDPASFRAFLPEQDRLAVLLRRPTHPDSHALAEPLRAALGMDWKDPFNRLKNNRSAFNNALKTDHPGDTVLSNIAKMLLAPDDPADPEDGEDVDPPSDHPGDTERSKDPWMLVVPAYTADPVADEDGESPND